MVSIEQNIVKLKNIFEFRGLTLSVAESCTGGQLAASLTKIPGASKFFLGGVVSYHSSVKCKILKVPLSTIEVMGEVSEPVAFHMAEGVRSQIGSSWSMAITGIAGPSGGTAEKPIGMVCFAVAGPGVSSVETQYFGSQSREQIQNLSVNHAVQMILRSICD